MGTELEGCEGKLWTQHLRQRGHELRCLQIQGAAEPGGSWTILSPIPAQTLSKAPSPALCSASKPELLLQSRHQGVLDIGWCLSSTRRLNMLCCEQVFALLVLSWDTEVMSMV